MFSGVAWNTEQIASQAARYDGAFGYWGRTTARYRYKVVAAINGTGFSMANGCPDSAMAIGGALVKRTFGDTGVENGGMGFLYKLGSSAPTPGTPYLGGDGTMVTVPDLQMANESKKALDGIKIGYWHSVDDKLRERIQSALETDMSQQVSKMKSSLSGRHKLGDLALNMALARQRSASAFSTPQALVANVVFEGTASAVGRFPGQSAEERPQETSSPAGMDAQTEPERIGPQ